jgi:hypothetical protein
MKYGVGFTAVERKRSEPAASAVKSTAANKKQDDDNDQKGGTIHGSLLSRTNWDVWGLMGSALSLKTPGEE